MEEAGIIFTATKGQYSAKDVIGSGAYGVVYKTWDSSRKEMVAIKRLKNERTESYDGTALAGLREIGVLLELKPANHQNIVNLLNVFHIGEDRYLVMEYLEWDLLRIMQRYAQNYLASRVPPIIDEESDDDIGVGLPPRLYQSIVHQLLLAVEFCHNAGIVHRDIKPANVLVSRSGVVKLADFGLARSLAHWHRTLNLSVVTLIYRAPELLLGAPVYTDAIDVWSVGCVFAEIVTGYHLFFGDSEIHQLFLIFERIGTPTNANWPGVEFYPDYCAQFPRFRPKGFADLNFFSCVRDLVTKMLTLNPSNRVTPSEALKHRFFSGVSVVPLALYVDN